MDKIKITIVLCFITVLAITKTLAYQPTKSYYQTLENKNFKLSGEWQQGGIIKGQILNPSISDIAFKNKKINITKDKKFIIGFDRDDPIQQYLQYLLNGQLQKQTINIQKRTYKTQRIDGLANNKVNIDEKYLPRIRQEYRLAKNARHKNQNLDYFDQVFQIPTKGIITGVYGSQRILNGQPRRPHYGIDIAAKQGTPVYAPTDAIVNLVHNEMFFSGGTLIIDHGYGLTSTFIHLHKILVSEGQKVKKGDTIAEVGATGRVTGAHLDWRMNWFDSRLDPTLILDLQTRTELFQFN